MKTTLQDQVEFTSSEVAGIFSSYPDTPREKLLYLRWLIFETAAEIEVPGALEETTKWGEPSYIAPNGSTIRIDWKEAKPDRYGIYFHCQTRLVETFKELYRDYFTFEGKRAIIFSFEDEVPVVQLKHCIELALTYHNIKHLPLLGA